MGRDCFVDGGNILSPRLFAQIVRKVGKDFWQRFIGFHDGAAASTVESEVPVPSTQIEHTISELGCVALLVHYDIEHVAVSFAVRASHFEASCTIRLRSRSMKLGDGCQPSS